MCAPQPPLTRSGELPADVAWKLDVQPMYDATLQAAVPSPALDPYQYPGIPHPVGLALFHSTYPEASTESLSVRFRDSTFDAN